MSVISNTTVLINFAAIGQIDLLPALFGTICIPAEVFAELELGAAEGYPFLAPVIHATVPPAEHGWLQQTPIATAQELRLMTTLPIGLHRGEAACLAIAAQRHASRSPRSGRGCS